MRELLISGTCPKWWKQLFGAEDTSAETRGLSLDVGVEELWRKEGFCKNGGED